MSGPVVGDENMTCRTFGTLVFAGHSVHNDVDAFIRIAVSRSTVYPFTQQ